MMTLGEKQNKTGDAVESVSLWPRGKQTDNIC